MRLTILFDSPYWIGLLEVERDGCLYAARHIFGSEPSDQEVYQFVQRDLLQLQARMTTGVRVDQDGAYRRLNPKRVQREVRQQIAEEGIPNKAHEAMRLQIEQNKFQSTQVSREQRDALREHKREVAREKLRARHRGH